MKHLIFIQDIIFFVITWLITFFAPTYMFMVGITVLVFIDLTTGISLSLKRGEHITSYGLRKTVSKIVTYYNLLIACFILSKVVIEPYMNIYIPIFETVALYGCLAEFKSILENTSIKLKLPILDMLLNSLPGFKSVFDRFFPIKPNKFSEVEEKPKDSETNHPNN